jgi:uncharacterized protein YqeY
MIIAAVMNAEVAGNEAVVLSDEQIMAVLLAEGKKRTEAAQIYADNDRAEAAAKERSEYAIIERYLPAAMSDDELNAIVQEEAAKAAAAGATGGKAMGVVVKAVRERVGTGADGSRVSAAVKIALG